MKIKSKLINHFNKNNWHINLIPGINFGNQIYGNGIVINISWLYLYWNINIFWK